MEVVRRWTKSPATLTIGSFSLEEKEDKIEVVRRWTKSPATLSTGSFSLLGKQDRMECFEGEISHPQPWVQVPFLCITKLCDFFLCYAATLSSKLHESPYCSDSLTSWTPCLHFFWLSHPSIFIHLGRSSASLSVPWHLLCCCQWYHTVEKRSCSYWVWSFIDDCFIVINKLCFICSNVS